MRRICIIVGVLAVAVCAVMAPAAFAVSQSEAGAISNTYAEAHWHVGDVEHCAYSGKQKLGEGEWFCYGYAKQWLVNVGPDGEITYAGLE